MVLLVFSFFSLYLFLTLYFSKFLFTPSQNLVVWFISLLPFSYPAQIIILTVAGLATNFYFYSESYNWWFFINLGLSALLIKIHLIPILRHFFNFDFWDYRIQGAFPVPQFQPMKFRLYQLLGINNPSWKNKKTMTFKARDGVDMQFDLWQAEKPNAPVVIQIFGGGYTIGSKDQLPHFNRTFTDMGYHVICPNYRLMPKWTWPTPANDIEDFWKALPSFLEKENLNPQFYVFSGRSAGSHLASYTICKLKDPKIKGYINLYGPQNWPDLLRFSHDGDVLDSAKNMNHFFQRDVGQDPEFLKSASPYFMVTSDFPKTLNLHGQCDPLVPTDQTLLWSEKLKQLQVPSATFILPYATHVFDWSLYSPAGLRARYLIQHFLKHLTSDKGSR